MKANYSREPEEKKMTEVDLGTTLYDMNKQLMMNQEPINSEERDRISHKLGEWFWASFNSENNYYFMLLCNERKDYTIFNLLPCASFFSSYKERAVAAAKDVFECMDNRGELISIDLQEDGVWELWLKVDGECFAYYLFPYGSAVLEY